MITATDKHGAPIEAGDVVDFVYGGDHHIAVVEAIETVGSVPHLTLKPTAKIPAPAVHRVGRSTERKGHR